MSQVANGAHRAASQPGAIPFKADEAVPAAGGVLVAAVLLIAAAGFVLAAWWQRRRGGKTEPRSRVRVLETVRLGPGTTLSVIEFDGRELLLAQSTQGVQRIAAARERQQ